jgi:hypothetical protein
MRFPFISVKRFPRRRLVAGGVLAVLLVLGAVAVAAGIGPDGGGSEAGHDVAPAYVDGDGDGVACER